MKLDFAVSFDQLKAYGLPILSLCSSVPRTPASDTSVKVRTLLSYSKSNNMETRPGLFFKEIATSTLPPGRAVLLSTSICAEVESIMGVSSQIAVTVALSVKLYVSPGLYSLPLMLHALNCFPFGGVKPLGGNMKGNPLIAVLFSITPEPPFASNVTAYVVTVISKGEPFSHKALITRSWLTVITSFGL